MIFAIQIRGARGLLKMSQSELAKETGLSLQTIVRLESDEESIKKASLDTIIKIRNVLKEKGIKFIAPRDDKTLNGVGVRLFTESDENE
jgi:transcriptional regulator with XRE-family HTH domain